MSAMVPKLRTPVVACIWRTANKNNIYMLASTHGQRQQQQQVRTVSATAKHHIYQGYTGTAGGCMPALENQLQEATVSASSSA
jgi:hypothetical protein